MTSLYSLLRIFVLVFGVASLMGCKRQQLKGRTKLEGFRPFQIVILEPVGEHDFYHRMYPLLNQPVTAKNGKTYVFFNARKFDKDLAIGWLQHQFETHGDGIGLKAYSFDDADKTSEEIWVQAGGKASFTATYDLSAIPAKWLDPLQWQTALAKEQAYAKVAKEKESFGNAGKAITHYNGLTDTAYIYPYKLNVKITANFYDDDTTRFSFTMPVSVGIYHKPKF